MPERRTRRQVTPPGAAGHRAPAERPEQADMPVAGPGARTPRQVAALQRAAGNRAVNGMLRAAGPPGGPVVQRWAWLPSGQVRPEEPTLSPQMKTLASDSLVHDYAGDAEFAAHAAGLTDHLGNLPGPASRGTWVRFAPAGCNLLGERHNEVTLDQVVTAVGSTNFVYEQFSVDTMPPSSEMNAAYQRESKDAFARFGVGGAADKQRFGAESLFPKMGFAMQQLLPVFAGRVSLAKLGPGLYAGKPLQRYLKIAWGHGKDVVAEVGSASPGKSVPPEFLSLAKSVSATRAKLDRFITELPVDGYLGDALDVPGGPDLLPPLLEFSTAFVDAMLARAATDTALPEVERKGLGAMPAKDPKQKEAVFRDWRNLHFAHAVEAAAIRGVRYAGMGQEHLAYLAKKGLPRYSQAYEMAGQDLKNFEGLTKNLTTSRKF